MKAMKYFFAVAMFAAASASMALPIDFEMGNGSWIDTSNTVAALELWAQVYPSVGSEAFSLNPGESYTFLFAQVGTNESWINADDLALSSVTAHLDFDVPTLVGSVPGFSAGFSGLFQYTQGWTLTWNDPVLVNFGGDGLFTIELSDATYSSGFWMGPNGGPCGDGYADIYATVTLIDGPSITPFDPIPEPATMSLLGLGLAGLALRRKFMA